MGLSVLTVMFSPTQQNALLYSRKEEILYCQIPLGMTETGQEILEIEQPVSNLTSTRRSYHVNRYIQVIQV